MSNKTITNKIEELERPSKEFPRKYVKQAIDFSSWENIEPFFTELLNRDLDSVESLENWIQDENELASIIGEEDSRRSILMTCHTEDKEKENAFLHFVENIHPKLKPITFALNKKLINCNFTSELDQDYYGLLLKHIKTSIKIFREENVPLQTELDKLSQQYQKILGAMMVNFQGEEKTMQQMGVYMESKDRSVRKEAYELSSERRLKDAEKLEKLFNKMLKLRNLVAKNAGFEDYRSYMFEAMHRYDYTPEDCLDFHKAIEEVVVPLRNELLQKRSKALGIDKLRPWDTACDKYGRDPLKPFENTDDLAYGCQRIFNKVNPDLGSNFQRMIDLGLLDLDSRKGKAPGGYQSTLLEIRLPFIFMNSVGLNRDVFTLLHEGGHAFHTFATMDEPLINYRHAPMEFCEVASMAMEHIGGQHLSEFYNEADSARAWVENLESDIMLLPWIATIDAFQHWIYTHPNHTDEERADYWLELSNKFGSGVDHTGYEEVLKYRWHAQLHIFEVPFYYIEYGIALLGALQVWRNSRQDLPAAIEAYQKALSLGGTKPLPEIFKTANAKFDFSSETIQPLIEEVRTEIQKFQSS